MAAAIEAHGGGGPEVVGGVAGGGEEVEEQPEDEGLIIGRRWRGRFFVDQPGGGEGEDEQGGDGPAEEVDPRGVVPGGDGFRHLPEPPDVGRAGPGFEAEVEDDGERAREADDAEAVIGLRRQGRRMRRATPRELRMATIQIRGTGQGTPKNCGPRASVKMRAPKGRPVLALRRLAKPEMAAMSVAAMRTFCQGRLRASASKVAASADRRNKRLGPAGVFEHGHAQAGGEGQARKNQAGGQGGAMERRGGRRWFGARSVIGDL